MANFAQPFIPFKPGQDYHFSARRTPEDSVTVFLKRKTVAVCKSDGKTIINSCKVQRFDVFADGQRLGFVECVLTNVLSSMGKMRGTYKVFDCMGSEVAFCHDIERCSKYSLLFENPEGYIFFHAGGASTMGEMFTAVGGAGALLHWLAQQKKTKKEK